MRERHDDTPDFLSKKDARFRDLQGTLECTFSDLRKRGVGAEVKHTPVITKEEEDQIWKAGVMGTDTPKQLLNTVFFLRREGVLFEGRCGTAKFESFTVPAML